MSNNVCSRICPICNNNVGDVLHTQEFVQTDFVKANRLLPPMYDVIACSKCGFVYADTSFEQ